MRKEIYLRSGKTLEGKFHKVPGVNAAPGPVMLQEPDHQEKEPQPTWEEFRSAPPRPG